jgi:hypothetical protein
MMTESAHDEALRLLREAREEVYARVPSKLIRVRSRVRTGLGSDQCY